MNAKFSVGFPDQSIEEIIEIASHETTHDTLCEHTSLTNNKFFDEILLAIKEVVSLPECTLATTDELEYFSDNNNDSLIDGSEAGGYDVDTVDNDSAYDESEASDTMDI